MTPERQIELVEWIIRFLRNWPTGADDEIDRDDATAMLAAFEKGEDAWEAAADLWKRKGAQ